MMQDWVEVLDRVKHLDQVEYQNYVQGRLVPVDESIPNTLKDSFEKVKQADRMISIQKAKQFEPFLLVTRHPGETDKELKERLLGRMYGKQDVKSYPCPLCPPTRSPQYDWDWD